jgi:hypothetical protein
MMIIGILVRRREMDIIVVLALFIGAVVCLLPGIMAWSHYLSSREKVAKARPAVKATRRVATGNVC